MTIEYVSASTGGTTSSTTINMSLTASSEWGNLIVCWAQDDRRDPLNFYYGGDAMTRVIDRTTVGTVSLLLSAAYILTDKTGSNTCQVVRPDALWTFSAVCHSYKYSGDYINFGQQYSSSSSGSYGHGSVSSDDMIAIACHINEGGCGGASPNPTTVGYVARQNGSYDSNRHEWATGHAPVTGSSLTVGYNSINCWPHNISGLAFEPGVLSGVKRTTFFFSLAGLAIPAAMGQVVVPTATEIAKLT